MPPIRPMALDEAPPEEARRQIEHHFSWTRPYRRVLQDAIDWQQAASPRPNFYFRWHLPRLVATLELMETAFQTGNPRRILDVACFPPYSLQMERWAASGNPDRHWTRTSYRGGSESFSLADRGETAAVDTVGVNLNEGNLPFEDGAFDLILFMETIEHVLRHPQAILLEMNRVLSPGGMVLITTPNVASWKKIKGLSDGNWGFDSPTFGGEWGHRYEFSPYQLRSMLRATGFAPVREVYRDVYFDDPRGPITRVQYGLFLLAKGLTGEVRRALKLARQAGSGMFLLWRKERDLSGEAAGEFVTI